MTIAGGHGVRRITPIYIKPFLKRQKNDAANAPAIGEAALWPNMHFVAVESAEHQARAIAFRARHCFVGQRTQLTNVLRGHLAAFRVVVAKGPAIFKALVDLWKGEAIDVPEATRDLLQLFLEQIEVIASRIDAIAPQPTKRLRKITRCGV